MSLSPLPQQPGEIHCRTLPDILREHDMPRVIDWLSLDVERAELEILDSQQRRSESLSFGGFKIPCWPHFLIVSFVQTDSDRALETYCVCTCSSVNII